MMDDLAVLPPTSRSSLVLVGNTPQVAEPEIPTQHGPHGIRFDFNAGCRILLPPGKWRVQLHDLDTANLVFDQILDGGMVSSAKKYFVRFRLEVWLNDVSVFRHDYNAEGQDVLARMEIGGLGDQIAWLGHAVSFAEQHGCRLTCSMRPAVIRLFREAYPQIRFLTASETDPNIYYATYKLFIFYNDHRNLWQPSDYRSVGLCHTAAYMLGVQPCDRRPDIVVDPGGPPIDEPYVCIATQATSQNKYWNNPHGWTHLIIFLKAHGYRVICIDQKPAHGHGSNWNYMPYGAEDETGDRPLTERARWLTHAAFFVGLSSGLAWLAWAACCPVVMISGFTHPLNEFRTPYRVINWHACNSCSNDVRHQLDPTDFMWCPRHRDTQRQFECTRLITAAQVQAVIRTIPGFGVTPSAPQQSRLSADSSYSGRAV